MLRFQSKSISKAIIEHFGLIIVDLDRQKQSKPLHGQ